MPRTTRLDPQLTAQPFSIAEARAAGIGRGRLAGTDLGRPFHGVRSVGEHSLFDSYAPRLRPGDRFSHSSAAALWGAPLPAKLGDLPHVTAAAGLTRPRARGVVGHRSSIGVIVERLGLPASDAPTTFLELASLLTVKELVAVGDFLILDPRKLDPDDLRPHATLHELEAAIDSRPSRGVTTARRAFARLRTGVESPMETALRLLLEDARLPQAECGYELHDGRGRSIGWFDLAWPAWRAIAEYDGDQHRTSTRQYDRDIRRFDAAAEAGWQVVRVRSSGFAHPQDTVERVTRALERAGWRSTRRKRT
jgi:very-short-patch-repair endonuclease